MPISKNEITSSALHPGVVGTTMSGRITAPLCERQLGEFRRCLLRERGATWLIDVLDISGFDAQAVSAGSEWYDAFKASDGRRLIFVARNRAARMAAQALGFGSGIAVESFETRQEALERLGVASEALRNTGSG